MAAPRLFTNSIVYLFGNVLNGLVPFLLLPILTRYLTPAELGLVVNFQLLFAILVAVTSLSLPGSISVEYFKGDRHTLPGYVAACLAVIGSAGLVVVSILFLAAPLLEFLQLSRGWLFWCAISAMASSGFAIVLVLWQAAERPVPYVMLQFGQVLANAGLSVLLVINFGLGAHGRIVGLTVPVAMFGVAAIAWLLWSGRGRGLVKCGNVGRALRFGLPLLPHALAAIALAQGDRLILAQRVGLDDAGIYAVAMQIMLPLVMIADAINRAFAPWMFKRLREERRAEVAAAQIALLLLYTLGAGAYTCVVILGLGFFLGHRFAEADTFVYFILPGTIATSLYYAVVNPIFYSGRTELLAAVTLSGAAIYVLVGWLVAGTYGGAGLAVVYTSVSIIQTLIVFLVAQHAHRLPLREGWNTLWVNVRRYVRKRV